MHLGSWIFVRLFGSGNRAADMKGHDQPHRSHIAKVPDDVLQEGLLIQLEAEDLCRLSQVSKRFKAIAATEQRWQTLYKARFGEPSSLTISALKFAEGSWRLLFAAKQTTERQAAPWRKPSGYELSAAINNMSGIKQQHPDNELAVVFLVDGSGSVCEEDFACMTDFMRKAAQHIQQTAPGSKVSIVQFSNDVKVEVPLQRLDMAALDTAVDNMVRLNGGTNIAAAIQKAGQLLKSSAAPDALRRLVLLTDGRIDSYQSREAAAMVSRLADEQSHVGLFAFGVGRGVDKGELVRIIAGAVVEGGTAAAEECYVELCVKDEAPW